MTMGQMMMMMIRSASHPAAPVLKASDCSLCCADEGTLM